MKLKEYRSPVNGRLEVWLINGKKTLEAESVNYSYASLHKVFQQAFKKSDLSKQNIRNALILGFGGGSVAKILREEMGMACNITGVDADSLLFRIAEDDFGIRPDASLNCITARAEEFIAHNREHYDLIVVDVFVNDRVPEEITEESFLKNVGGALNPGGRIYLNLIVSHGIGKAQREKVRKWLINEGLPLNEIPLTDGNFVLWTEKT